MKDAPGTRDYDWLLLAILAGICALGVLEIYSATHGSSLAGMHMKQVRWLIVGFILMFALSRLDYHLILDQAPILYLIGLAALAAVLLIGHTRFGAKRWIPIPALGAFLGGLQWQHAAVFSLAGILLVVFVFYHPVSRHILKPSPRQISTFERHP